LWDFLVLARDTPIEVLRYPGGIYSKEDEDKPKDNPKYLAYYILLWIVYIDNYYKIY
jgi:hypothetical protein